MNNTFWKNKKLFLTGHTGFKGSWLCLYLNLLGAKVTGYALQPPTNPNLFELARIDQMIKSITGDVRDVEFLKNSIAVNKPEIIIHMAAQPLVRESYKVPVETFSTNVMGTVNLLEAVRACNSVKVMVNVTTDKVYEIRHQGIKASRHQGFCESDPLGGYDPYSGSKACSEIVTAVYRQSFLSPKAAVATARAGNVIGGGDWAADRLIPDFIRAILAGGKIHIRNPKAVRPWQHVLEPLTGYLSLAQKLYENKQKYAGAWNFGPEKRDAKTVEWIVEKLCSKWGQEAGYIIDKGKHLHETGYLRLDNTKAKRKLGWKPKWELKTAIDKIIEWTKAYQEGKDLRQACLTQIQEYCG
ncbi:MAG: CDP-glucose 4,6-dehydratase [Candidatus Margulisbacteria bacterium]|nr:CDP-glucose 4,6-dehydratase [Candidatus Margulisiibacteriota bacterium]